MPLKISMLNKFRQDKLIQDRDGTGIKPRPLLKFRQAVFGKYEVRHTDRGSNCS